MAAAIAQFAIHFPADPKQQDATSQNNPDDLQQLNGDGSEADAHHGRRDNTPENGLFPLFRWQTRRRHAHHDGVIASEHNVNEKNKHEWLQPFREHFQHF
jgi:hypothetical protein